MINLNSTSFVTVRRRFDFRSIEVGRWVTPEERDRAAGSFYETLCDLMTILQGPENLISLCGSRGVQFCIGGRPGVSAHYVPATRQLALAKNAGAGSRAGLYPEGEQRQLISEALQNYFSTLGAALYRTQAKAG